MICVFCNNSLIRAGSQPSTSLIRYHCLTHCGNNNLTYERLHSSESIDSRDESMLADYIKIDEFFISRMHMDPDHTNIYRSLDIGQVMLGSKTKVCVIPGIVNFPFHDINLVKKKLQTYVTFS